MTHEDTWRATIDPGPAAGFRPIRDSGESAWTGHRPFAAWIVHALRPRVFVELGVHRGDSYSAFCQAALEAFAGTAERPACRGYGVDTWRGDAHAGFYGESVYEEFKAFHDRHFGPGGPLRSVLLREPFDEAARRFEPGAIDLLHIDGLHTYEAARHDFETWIGRMSDRGVVLLHDVTVRERGFGVWRLWAEVCDRYPSFLFIHSFGLGVLGTGARCLENRALRELFDAGRNAAGAGQVRQLFEAFAARGSGFAGSHRPENGMELSYTFAFRFPPNPHRGMRSVAGGLPANHAGDERKTAAEARFREDPAASGAGGTPEPGAEENASESRRGALTPPSAAERRERIARLHRRFAQLQRSLVWLDWTLAAAVLGWGAATQRWLWIGLGALGLAVAAARPGERISAALLRTFVRRA